MERLISLIRGHYLLLLFALASKFFMFTSVLFLGLSMVHDDTWRMPALMSGIAWGLTLAFTILVGIKKLLKQKAEMENGTQNN